MLIAWTLLLLDGGETYGYALHHRLLALGVDVQATSVYRWLAKFERDRWVVSRWSDPVDGPRRHVYRLTLEGQVALREMAGVVAALYETYSTFADAHARAVARRGSEGVDEDAAPIMADDPARRGDAPVAAPQAPLPAPSRPLRPHKELLVGWLLLQLDAGATYGYDLRRAFEALRLSPDPAAMYRMLRRLEADKWVQSRWMSPAGGPRRRFYRLTGRGRRNLDEIARLIAVIRDAHEKYLHAYEHAQTGVTAARSSETASRHRSARRKPTSNGVDR
ncbi:MAG TPA: helix-turn-helix transcriptional regulator [Solirubrobacteraceae bacterium]|nr:helix-turn-helix transcriptional regulator [Solirubrobacteraceae bacterium]